MTFSKELLGLYGKEFVPYDLELLILFLGNFAGIAIGSSGTIMMMAGLEKYSLYIQIFRSLFILFASLLILPVFGVTGAVFVYTSAALFVTIVEIILIKKFLNIFPLDNGSFLLIALFLVLLWTTFTFRPEHYSFWGYLFIPVFWYALFLGLFHRKIIKIIYSIKNSS